MYNIKKLLNAVAALCYLAVVSIASLSVLPLSRVSAQSTNQLISTSIKNSQPSTAKKAEARFAIDKGLTASASNNPKLKMRFYLTGTGSDYGFIYANVYSDKIVFTCNGDTKTTNFTNADYANKDAGVSNTKTGGRECGFDYTFAPTTGTNSLILDLSTSGQVDISLKNGATSATTLIMNLMLPDLTTTKEIDISASYGTASTDCAALTDLLYDTAMLFDDVLTAMTLKTDVNACQNFDKSSYNADSKTAIIKHLAGSTSGVPLANTVIDGFASAMPVYHIVTSTNLEPGGTGKGSDQLRFRVSDRIGYSNNPALQVYITAWDNNMTRVNYGNGVAYIIADGIVDLSSKSINLNSLGVVLDSDKITFKAFIHNFNKATKDGSYSLYVPAKDGDNFVGICNGVSSLDAINNKCSGVYYLKEGQSKTKKDTGSIPEGKTVSASKTTINSITYWKITGLTSTGGFSTTLSADPDTGIVGTRLTSSAIIYGTIFGAFTLAFTSRYIVRSRR